MQAELDKIFKEKDQNVPMEVIPLNSFPITGVNTAMTTSTATREIPSATSVTALDAVDQLAKAMEDMTLQGAEIKKLQEEIQNLQKLNSTFQASYNTERHKSDKLKQELQQLQKEIVMAKTLSEAKENIWMDICQSVIDIWPLIQIMFE
jgi:DNA repair ATPase RecN